MEDTFARLVEECSARRNVERCCVRKPYLIKVTLVESRSWWRVKIDDVLHKVMASIWSYYISSLVSVLITHFSSYHMLST